MSRRALLAGDAVAAATRATGIDAVIKRIAPAGCGCADRRRRLNEFDARVRGAIVSALRSVSPLRRT
jgi:hypothetical protein